MCLSLIFLNRAATRYKPTWQAYETPSGAISQHFGQHELAILGHSLLSDETKCCLRHVHRWKRTVETHCNVFWGEIMPITFDACLPRVVLLFGGVWFSLLPSKNKSSTESTTSSDSLSLRPPSMSSQGCDLSSVQLEIDVPRFFQSFGPTSNLASSSALKLKVSLYPRCEERKRKKKKNKHHTSSHDVPGTSPDPHPKRLWMPHCQHQRARPCRCAWLVGLVPRPRGLVPQPQGAPGPRAERWAGHPRSKCNRPRRPLVDHLPSSNHLHQPEPTKHVLQH